MDVFKIIAFAILSVSIILLLKEQRKDIAMLISIVAGIGLLVFGISKLSLVIDLLNELIEKSGMNSEFLAIILKVTGIAYIVEFGKNICTDAGESAIGNKLEMAGKVIIVTLSIPLISSLMGIINELMYF